MLATVPSSPLASTITDHFSCWAHSPALPRSLHLLYLSSSLSSSMILFFCDSIPFIFSFSLSYFVRIFFSFIGSFVLIHSRAFLSIYRVERVINVNESIFWRTTEEEKKKHWNEKTRSNIHSLDFFLFVDIFAGMAGPVRAIVRYIRFVCATHWQQGWIVLRATTPTEAI